MANRFLWDYGYSDPHFQLTTALILEKSSTLEVGSLTGFNWVHYEGLPYIFQHEN